MMFNNQDCFCCKYLDVTKQKTQVLKEIQQNYTERATVAWCIEIGRIKTP